MCHEARKGSFRRKLCGVPFEQTTASEYRSALRRRKSLVPRGRDGLRFFRRQFSIERSALSINQNRDEFGARVCDQCKGWSRLGQFLVADLQRNLTGRRTGFFQPV